MCNCLVDVFKCHIWFVKQQIMLTKEIVEPEEYGGVLFLVILL